MYVILDGHFSLGLRTVAVHGTHLECRINTFPGVPGQQALRQIMQRPGRPGQARGHGRERADLTQMANSARFIVLVPMTSVAREIGVSAAHFASRQPLSRLRVWLRPQGRCHHVINYFRAESFGTGGESTQKDSCRRMSSPMRGPVAIAGPATRLEAARATLASSTSGANQDSADANRVVKASHCFP